MPQDAQQTVRFIAPDGMYDIPSSDKEAMQMATVRGWRRAPEVKPETPTPGMGQQLMGVPMGMAKTTVGPLLDPSTYKGMAQAAAPQNVGQGVAGAMGVPPLVQNMVKGVMNNPGSMFDIPGIQKDVENKQYGSAIGRGFGQLLLWASTLGKAGSMAGEASRMAKAGELGTFAKGGMKAVEASRATKATEEIAAIGGKASAVDKNALDAAKVVTAEHEAAWANKMQQLEKGMSNVILDFKLPQQALRDPLIRATNYISKVMERAATVKPGAVLDAQDVVTRLQERLIKSGGVLPWAEARSFMEELGGARGALKGTGMTQLSQKLSEISDTIHNALASSSKAAGYGGQYEQLVGQFRALSNWRRAYAKILKGATTDQMIAKVNPTSSTAQKVMGAGETMAGVGIAVGGHPVVGGAVATMGAERTLASGSKAATAAMSAATKTQLTKAGMALDRLGEQLGVASKVVKKGSTVRGRLTAAGNISHVAQAQQSGGW